MPQRVKLSEKNVFIIGNGFDISHVIKAIGVPEEYAKGTIRISLGKNNTVADVDKILCELKSIVS